MFYFLLTVEIVFPLLRGTQNLSKVMHRQDIAVAAVVVLVVFIVIGVFFPRPFCNYFCTGGARRGLWSVLRFIGIRRDASRCINCRQCSRNCPMHIDVASAEFVRHPNCIGCMTCMSVCPKDCIVFKHMPPPPGRKAGK